MKRARITYENGTGLGLPFLHLMQPCTRQQMPSNLAVFITELVEGDLLNTIGGGQNALGGQ